MDTESPSPVHPATRQSQSHIFLLCIILTATASVLVGYYVLPKSSSTISPYILKLTKPVHSFTGVVKTVSDTSIVLDYQTETLGPVEANALPPKPSILEAHVLLSNQTSFAQSQLAIPASAKQAPVQMDILNKESIRAGQWLTVTTDTDLRTLPRLTFQAKTVERAVFSNVISGRIESANGATLVVQGSPVFTYRPTDSPFSSYAAVATERKYTVIVAPDTRIYFARSKDTSGELTSATVDTIKTRTAPLSVTVYASGDVVPASSVTALIVELGK